MYTSVRADVGLLLGLVESIELLGPGVGHSVVRAVCGV